MLMPGWLPPFDWLPPFGPKWEARMARACSSTSESSGSTSATLTYGRRREAREAASAEAAAPRPRPCLCDGVLLDELLQLRLHARHAHLRPVDSDGAAAHLEVDLVLRRKHPKPGREDGGNLGRHLHLPAALGVLAISASTPPFLDLLLRELYDSLG